MLEIEQDVCGVEIEQYAVSVLEHDGISVIEHVMSFV